MRLECIEDIINGMQVFMPSGICAYLSVDNDGNVIAEYRDEMDSYSNTYTQDEFGNIIADGIEIFNEPSQIVMEDYDDVDMDNLHKKFDVKPTIAYELIYDGEPAGYPIHKSEDEIDSYVDELNAKGDIKVSYRKWKELKEDLESNYILVKAKDVGNEIEILDVEKGYNSFEDVQMAINDLESEEEFQADPTLMLFVGYEKDGILYNAVTDEEMGEMEDFEPIAYEDGSKPYSDSKWDRLSDLFQENKIEDMNKLDKIAKVGKDVKDRQKATSLLDATGLGADVKDEVKKFLKKDKEIQKDESLNEDQYEGPDEEEFYTVTFTDGTTDNGFSYVDGQLFYNNELIADIIEVDFNMEVAQKIADYCELELDKEVEDIEDGIGQSLLESMNEISDKLANRFLNKRVKNAVDNNYDEESTEKENRALTALIKRKARQGKKLDANEKQFISNESLQRIKVEPQEDGKWYIASYNNGKIGTASRGKTPDEAIATLKKVLKRDYGIDETVDTEKLFAIDDLIADIENQLMKINSKINKEAPNATAQLFRDRDELEYQLKSLKQKREKILNESLNEISQQLKNTVAAKRQIDAEKANEVENNILSEYGRGSKAKAAHNKTVNAIKKLNKFNRRSADIIGTDEYQKLGGKFVKPGVARKIEENNMNNIRKLRIQLESLVNELTSKNEAMSVKDAKALYKKQGFLDTKDDKDAIEALKRGNYTIKTNSRGTATVVELEKLAKNETYNKFIVNMMIDGNKENGSDENVYQEEFDSMKDAIAEVIRLTKTQPQAYIELVNLHTDEILFDSKEVREQNMDYVDAGIETEEDLMEALEDEMLTDINDLDFPDALADTVETTEDGEILTLEKAVAEIKDEIEDLKDDIKDEIEDLKDSKDIKDDYDDNDDNDDNDDDDDDDDLLEESFNGRDLKTAWAEEMKMQPIMEFPNGHIVYLEPDYERNVIVYGGATNTGIIPEGEVEFDNTKSLDWHIEGIYDELINDNLEESYKKYLTKGKYEDLNKTKQEIDKLNREGKSADKIKDTITLMSGDEKEEKQATDYAVSKLKESLLNTKYSSKLSNL